MRILLTGGDGFIGGHLKKILSKNHEIFEVKRLKKNRPKNKNILYYGNNINDLLSFFNLHKPEIVVHLAAVSHANKSNKDPYSTFDHSLRTLENTLDVAKNRKTHTIFMSSSMVYGNFEKGKVDEKSNCKPIGIYGSLKLSGELLIKAYNQVFDLPYTIIRPSALYGERCVSRRVGQIFIENSLTSKKILIKGTGEEKLDFTYIEDLVEGISLCCEKDESRNQTFNITYGNSRSIMELLNILQEEFSDLEIKFEKKEKFMPERGTLDNSKANRLLNFKPKYQLEKGFKNYIDWYKKFWTSIKTD